MFVGDAHDDDLDDAWEGIGTVAWRLVNEARARARGCNPSVGPAHVISLDARREERAGAAKAPASLRPEETGRTGRGGRG